MTTKEHQRFATQFRRYFLDELQKHEALAFRGHVRDCDECRTEYERWAHAESALFNETDGLNPLSLDRLEHRMSTAPAPSTRSGAWLGGLVAAAAAVLIVVAIPRETMTPRGGESLRADVSLRVLGVNLAPDGAPEIRVISSGEAITEDSRIQVVVQSPFSHVRVSQVLPSGQTTPLIPVTELKKAGDEARVGPALDPRELPRGELRLVAVFGSGPERIQKVALDATPRDAQGVSVRNFELRIEVPR